MDNKNDFFRQVTLLICSSLDIEVSLVRCLLYFQKKMPADEIFISLYESGLRAVRVLVRATKDSGRLMNLLVPVSEQVRSEIEKNYDQDVKIINRSALDRVAKAMTPAMDQPHYSALVMPLKIEGNILGEVLICAYGKDRYTKDHADLLSVVADPFAIAVSNALRHQEVTRLRDRFADDNQYLRRELRHLSGDQIIGKDFGLKTVLEMVRKIAGLDTPVLLLGETGTGKEIIANTIHFSSPRKKGPFIRVNCGAIPETLMDSEFFGHEKGAFTGAVSNKKGKFERAHQGTIFLDEIGELPLGAQVRLLRAIQNRVIERVGGTGPVPVDIRIIAATHRDLHAMVDEGRFREDLWFRLNIFPILIPPLRERTQDIPALVHHFIERNLKTSGGLDFPALAPEAMNQLMNYHWPGNVRELENMVERAMILRRGDRLTFDAFDTRACQRKSVSDRNRGRLDSLDQVIIGHIRRALEKSGGRIHGPRGAAAILDINPSTLRNRMKRLGICSGRNKRIPDDKTPPR